jgi:hypothetical protein
MLKRIGWILVSVAAIIPLAALCADRLGGEDVLPLVPHDPEMVELNRLLWTPGEPVAPLYGNPMGRSVRVVFPAGERLILADEQPGLRLLSMADGPGRRPLQAGTLWFVAWGAAGASASAGALALALAALAQTGRRRRSLGPTRSGLL